MSPAQRALTQVIRDTTRGGTVGPFDVMVYSAGVGEAVMALYGHLRHHSVTPLRILEMAALLTAKARRCDFIWWAHVKVALDCGLAAGLIADIRAGRRPSTMADDEAALHDFAVELLCEGRASEATFVKAVALFGREGLVEIAAIMGQYSLVSLLVGAGAVEPPLDIPRESA